MKPLSEVVPGLLIIQIPIQAVCTLFNEHASLTISNYFSTLLANFRVSNEMKNSTLINFLYRVYFANFNLLCMHVCFSVFYTKS